MSKAKRSGIVVNHADVPIILGMLERNDRKHDIAAWFGLNQGRIKEVQDGEHGSPAPAAEPHLPPVGSPGPRARALRADVQAALKLFKKQTINDTAIAVELLKEAIVRFDAPA